MNIFINHFPISQFISENKGKISETKLELLVERYVNTKFASEFATEQLMWQAKPNTMMGEWLIEKCGGKQEAIAELARLVELILAGRGGDEFSG